MHHSYSDKEELKNVLLKSCHLPFISDGNIFIQDNSCCYLDGAFPYIFSEREQVGKRKLLYISLSKLSKIKDMFFIKNETSIYGRISEGILDGYQFFF